jgi:hypothetical protein
VGAQRAHHAPARRALTVGGLCVGDIMMLLNHASGETGRLAPPLFTRQLISGGYADRLVNVSGTYLIRIGTFLPSIKR